MSPRKRKLGRGGTSSAGPPASPAVSSPRPTRPLTRRETLQYRAARRRHAAQIRAAQTAAHEQHWIERYSARAELRNAEAREKLVPLAPHEQPWALRIAILLAMVFSLGTFALMVAGVKVDHRPPSASWIIYVIVMFACGAGMWRHWSQAVLAFMCLLGIALVILCVLVVRFSNLLGLVIPLVLIVAGGAEFWKLVGVLARLQTPPEPARSL